MRLGSRPPRFGVVTTEMARVWDGQAATFDDGADHGLLDPTVRKAWAVLLRECIPEPSAVLDAGCGTGSLAVLMAEQGHTVTGLDLSPNMLTMARSKAARHDVEVCFHLADAAQPAVDAGFDVVLARHLVWALPDPSAAVDRWLALLRDQGTLVLIEGLLDTGAGLSAQVLGDLLALKMTQMSVRPLDDPALWGRAITDEPYLLIATG